jgi:hypothetical protein
MQIKDFQIGPRVFDVVISVRWPTVENVSRLQPFWSDLTKIL